MFDKIERIRICAQKKTQNLNKEKMKRKLNYKHIIVITNFSFMFT